MKPKKAVKELEKQLRKDPENLVLRLRLAAALREVGRTEQAVTLYRSVAVQYHSEGRLAQAVAVCRSVLEIDPNQRETQALLVELEAMLQAHAMPADPHAPTLPPAGYQQAPPAPPRSVAPPPIDDEPDEVLPASSSSPSLPSTQKPTRQLPNVRVLDAPSGRGRARPPANEFDRKSGLTPAEADLELPSLAQGSARTTEPRRKSDPVINEESRPPGVRSRRRSAPIAAQPAPRDTARHSPPRMPVGPGPAPRITPTPLPQPLASHDADEDESMPTNPKMQPIPRPPPPPPLVGRDDDDDVDDDALTTVAPESGWRPPAPDDLAAPEPAGPEPPPAPEPEPAGTPGAPAGVFDEATRFGDSLAEVGAAALRPPPADPEPPRRARRTTRNTLRVGEERPSRPLGKDARVTNRLVSRRPARPPSPDNDPDEITGVRRVARPKPAGSFDDDEAPTRIDDAASPGRGFGDGSPGHEVADDDEGMGLERAFDRTFAETLSSLAPDGSAIDSPLTIFSELPEEALNELVRRMVLRSFRPGEIVLREGDPGDACFVIASGSVRVLKRDPSNERSEMIEVARLGSGAVFGEFALLADRRRHATVQAVEPTDLYEIPRRLLRELAATFDDVGPALERFYRERLLSTLLATAPFFGPLEEDGRANLLARFEPQRCESGERVIEEGQKAGGLYLIVLGAVEITKRVSERRSVLLTTLGEGAYFGELSLMRGGTARATVTATGPTELAVLPPDAFYEIVAANPVLWEEIRKEAHRRELMLRQIVTGESGVV